MTTPDAPQQPQPSAPAPQNDFIDAVLGRFQAAAIVRDSITATAHSLLSHAARLERTYLDEAAERISDDLVLRRFIEHLIGARRAGLPDGALRAAAGVIAARMDEVARPAQQAALDAIRNGDPTASFAAPGNGTGPQPAADATAADLPAQTGPQPAVSTGPQPEVSA